jgi:N-acyl-L-homoserine lactone synthetase
MGSSKLLSKVSQKYKVSYCISNEEIRLCKGLRHFVYCTEKNWEPESIQQIEEDDHDVESMHFLIQCRITNTNIGTFRLINSDKLPLDKFMPENNIFHPKNLPVNSVCEVSRFSIIKEYRNLELLHALFLLVGYESNKRSFVGAYMVMERSLAVQLRRSKINCRQITQSFLLNGNRAIYFCSVVECLNAIDLRMDFDKSLIDRLFLPLYENDIKQASNC